MSFPPLSALAKFDDLVRCQKELSLGVAEESKLNKKNKIYLFFENQAKIFLHRIPDISPSI